MKLSNKMIRDYDISHKAFATYVALLQSCPYDEKTVFSSASYISFCLSGNPEPSINISRFLSSGLKELESKNIVKVIKSYSKIGCKILELEDQHWCSSNYYSWITSDEIRKIFNYDYSASTFGIFRAYCVLLSTMRKNEKHETLFGNFRIEDQLELIDLSKSTYLKYIKILKDDIGLIHIYRPKAFYFNESGLFLSGVSNTYGKKEDAEKIDIIGMEHLSSLQRNNKRIKKHRPGINQRRSASAKYNSYLNGKEYPNEELEAIYNTLFQMNKEYSGDSDLMNLDRVKDLTAFKDCDFYRGEGTEKTEEGDLDLLNELY